MVLDIFSGLPDMEILQRRLRQLVDAQGESRAVAVLLLVVDRIQAVAAQYGVSAAQQLNGQLVARLLRVVQGEGNVFCSALGRFVVVLSAAPDEARGRRDGEAIRAQLCGTYIVDTQFVRIDVRFGVALHDGTETAVESLLARAFEDLESQGDSPDPPASARAGPV